MDVVHTVLGPVPPERLGQIMHHEHLLSLTPGPWLAGGPRPGSSAEDELVALAVSALRGLAALGIGTVVDLSPYGVVGRDADGDNVRLLRRISRESSLHIVAGTAVYLEAYSPRWAVMADLNSMTERFLRDAADGIGGSGVRAGVFGEQATGLDQITAHEEKCLRAAIRAQRESGLGLTTHTTHGSMALEQVDILRQERADLSRVVIGHLDTHPSLDYVREVARTGVNIAFDTIGKQNWDFFLEPEPANRPDGEFGKLAYHQSDSTRAARIAALVQEGHVDQILLAQDLTGAEVYLNPGTHGQSGYSYLGRTFTAMLLERGVTEQQVDTMMRANPARLLAATA